MVLGCIVQARMGSSRLPGKVLSEIDGNNPILYYVITQLQECKSLDEIVIATTILEEDEKIVKYVENMGLPCFRGSPNDVLDRYYQCAKKFNFSNIVRVTADCPLIDPTLVDQVIQKFFSEPCDYSTNSLPKTFPQGTETEIFSFAALENAWENAKKPSEREHVTSYIKNNKNFKKSNVRNSKDLSDFRWTVDRIEDLKLVKELVSRIKKRPILMTDILEVLSSKPELIEINKNHIKDEGFLKSLKEDPN